MAFLIDEFGENNFQQFIALLAQGNTVDAALVKVYGFNIDGLDVRWAGEAPGAPAPAPSAPGSGNPSSILFFNSSLLGGLMLLVFAVVSIRLLASKLRPAGDPEEGLQPWEDPDLLDDDEDRDGDGSYFR